MNKEQSTKCLRILMHYRADKQKLKCCEELTELLSAILWQINKGNHVAAIIDEMADVYIMMEQLKYMLPGVEMSLGKKIDEKLDRQLKRIQSGE